MAAVRFFGPTCRYRSIPQIDAGTSCRQSSPIPGPINAFSVWPELRSPGFMPAALGLDQSITDADRAEFEIIKKMPVYNHKRRPFHNVKEYVSDRTLFFGSPSAYSLFAAESDAELANTQWVGKKKVRTLSSMLEFAKNPGQQQIFYRWVRKAYKHKYGADASVPDLIRKGMSQSLADKIADVRGSKRVTGIHDENFHAGGFNARPIKYAHHYLLGTLSEHATGLAVDIDDSRNAQLTNDEWAFIEKLVGKRVLRSGRWTTEADAEGLWKDISDMSRLFVAHLSGEETRISKERAGKPKPAKQLSPLEEVLGRHFSSLSKWASNGFFQLPLELVLELHAHGFNWGATFRTNVDLHHFELPQ